METVEKLLSAAETEKRLFAMVLSQEITQVTHRLVMDAVRDEIKTQLATNEQIKAKIREAIINSIVNLKVESPEATVTFGSSYREDYL